MSQGATETTVRCADCGFFTVPETGTGTLIAANAQMRTGSVNFPQTWSESARDFVPLHPVLPTCYEQAFPLYDEMQEFLKGRNSNIPQEVYVAFSRVADKDRSCSEFVTWQQGASPQQHREMRDREREREREDRLRREAQEREDRRDATTAHDRRIDLLIAAVIGGAFGVLATVIGVLVLVWST